MGREWDGCRSCIEPGGATLPPNRRAGCERRFRPSITCGGAPTAKRRVTSHAASPRGAHLDPATDMPSLVGIVATMRLRVSRALQIQAISAER